MYIRKSKPYSIWVCLLMLLHLAAGALPAKTVYATTHQVAAAQFVPGPCEDNPPGAAAAEPLVIAASSEEVKIPKETVDKAAYLAKWAFYFREGAGVEAVIRDMFIMTVPFEFGTQITQLFDKAEIDIPRAQVNDTFKFPHDAIVHTYLDLALQIPELAPFVPIVWNEINADLPKGQVSVDQPLLISQSAQRYDYATRMLELAGNVVNKSRECAMTNAQFARLFDSIFKPILGASITESASSIFTNDPALMVPDEIKNNIQPDGSLTITLDELKDLSVLQFEVLNHSIEETRKTVLDIDERQKSIVKYLANQAEKEAMADLAKKRAAEQQLVIDASKSAITIISTIAKQIDPKTGKSIETVGNSLISVGVAVNGWLKATAGLKALDKVFSLSTVVMTGNVLGAVMNVVGLFGPGQPNLDKEILKQIGELREQVEGMRVEMHQRFDRIDQGLNAIYSTMMDRFNQIDVTLGRIEGNIAEVQRSLVQLDLQLSRIERNNFEFLNVLGRRPLLEAINGGLGYEERTGQPMPFQPDFVGFENTLHSWATIHAFDPLNAGPTQRDFSDGQVLAELAAFPLDSNINYINGWLQTHGLPGIANKRLASPRDWLFAARAYTRLGIEWPELMAQIDVSRLDSLNNVGLDLEAAMRSLSTQVSAAGAQGNTLLFSSVITGYQNKLANLDAGIAGMETGFVNEVQASLQRTAPFNLFGGSAQQVNFTPPATQNFTCFDNAQHGSLPATSNIAALIPNFDLYKLADYLRVGRLDVCVTNSIVDAETVCTIDPDPPFEERCNTIFTCNIILSASFDHMRLMKQSLPTTSCSSQIVPNNWTAGGNLRARYSTLGADPLTEEEAAQYAATLQTVKGRVESSLASYQQVLYGRIVESMQGGALAPAAKAAGGAKQLVDAIASLGLPRAVASDEFLHAMLFGNQQIMGNDAIMQRYAISATQPITGAALLTNARLAIKQENGERTDALKSLLNEYLDAISAQTHKEEADYLASARRALDLTVRIAHIVAGGPTIPTPPATPTPPSTPTTPTPPVTPTPPPLDPNQAPVHVFLPVVGNQ